MFTKFLRMTSALLPTAACLTLSSGCASTDKSTRTNESRRNTTYVASRSETPLYPPRQQSVNDTSYSTRQSYDSNMQTHTVAAPSVADQTRAHAAESRYGPGLATAESQQSHVTVVSAKEPPLTRVETPSHTPGREEFWVGGHWVADASGFSWQPGRIEQLRPGELFVAGGWQNSPQGWEFTPEYWR